MNNEAKVIIDDIVNDEDVVFAQVYISADGSWPDGSMYSDWRDYVHIRGGKGHYNPDTDQPEEYVKERLHGCEDVTILAVQFKTINGEEISIPLEC